MDHGSWNHGSESNDWMGGSRMESLMGKVWFTVTPPERQKREESKRMVTLQSPRFPQEGLAATGSVKRRQLNPIRAKRNL